MVAVQGAKEREVESGEVGGEEETRAAGGHGGNMHSWTLPLLDNFPLRRSSYPDSFSSVFFPSRTIPSHFLRIPVTGCWD